MTNINKLDLPDYKTWKDNYLQSQRHKDFLKELFALENNSKNKLNPRARDILSKKKEKLSSYIITSDFTWTSYWFEYILSTLNPGELILDIGCGENIFKKIYPEYNILSCNPIREEHFGCDFFYEFSVTSKITTSNKGKNKSLRDLYSNVGGIVAFNSAHFCTPSGVAENCKTMVEALRPAGYVALSINCRMMYVHSFKYSEKRKSYYVNALLDALIKCEEFNIVYFSTRFDTFEIPVNTGDIHIVIQKSL